MKKHIFGYFLAAVLALGLTPPLMKSRSGTGSLGGEVLDPSGAVVPRARVVVFKDRWAETLSTDNTGQYVATGLSPGTYEVSVSSEGFAPFDRAGLVVAGGERTEMDAMLEIAVLKQGITITADASSGPLSHLRDTGAPAYIAQ